jgi:hypothetical protein
MFHRPFNLFCKLPALYLCVPNKEADKMRGGFTLLFSKSESTETNLAIHVQYCALFFITGIQNENNTSSLLVATLRQQSFNLALS